MIDRYDSLYHTSIRARIVIAVTFQKVDRAPNTEASAEGDHEGLKYLDCGIEEIHSQIWNRIFYFVVILLFVCCVEPESASAAVYDARGFHPAPTPFII